jgi:hypothetical protein
MVFQDGDAVYMIPESASTGETNLYKFDDFPFGARKERRLLFGLHVDSSCMFHNEIWYIFTTSDSGLEIYYTDDIATGRLTAHPANPITNDPSIRRSAGTPLLLDGRVVRLAQDGSTRYGANVNGLHVTELTPETYREQPLFRDYFDCADEWNTEGVHHLTMASFMGETVVAVDGRHRDLFINRFLSLLFNGLAWFRQRLGSARIAPPMHLPADQSALGGHADGSGGSTPAI